MRHYFEFDGVKSSDYGVFISGAQTMGAAGRDVDEIVVPGRDGNLTIDNGRFNAIGHVYPAFIAERAKEGLKGLRNALLSKRGHKRLSDTVHPDEFYRAYYEHGLEPDVTANLRHSEFEIEFTRDPRRFLVAGDTPQDVAMNTETLSGSVVTFDNATGADSITGLSVSIMAEQSGSGDPSPTNIRPISGWTGAKIWNDPVYGGTIAWNQFFSAAFTNSSNGVTFTRVDSATVHISGTASSTAYKQVGTTQTYEGRVYFTDRGTDNENIGFYNDNKGVGSIFRRFAVGKATANKTMYLRIASGAEVDEIVKPQIFDLTQMFGAEIADYIYSLEQANTGAGVAWFKELFPKDYYPYNAGEETNVSAVNEDPYGLTEVTWSDTAGTVYGGTLDVMTGVLTVDRAIVDLGTLDWVYVSDRYFYAEMPSNSTTPIVGGAQGICSQYLRVQGSVSALMATDGAFTYNNTGFTSAKRIFIRDTRYTDATSFESAMSGVQLVYELATPLEYDLAPTEIETLLGQNNVWADCGDVSVTLQLPSTLINPTRFPSSPKIRVHGQGTLYIGNTAITVGGNFPYVDIDTEIADCSYEGQNANQYVTFSGLDFPKLEPGENYITFTGFTAVEVTPRWWRL